MSPLLFSVLAVVVAIALGVAYRAGLERGAQRAYRDTLHKLDRAMAEDRRLFLTTQAAHNYRGNLVEGAAFGVRRGGR